MASAYVTAVSSSGRAPRYGSPNQIGNSRRLAASNTIAASAGIVFLLTIRRGIDVPSAGGAASLDPSGPITATRAQVGRSGVQVAGEERDARACPRTRARPGKTSCSIRSEAPSTP